MKAIDLYAYYRALDRYFKGNEPLEVKAVNVETFKLNPELSRWEKLAGKREAKNYVLANILENNWIIKDFNDPAYLRWCAINENMLYNYKSDLETLFDKGITFNLLRLRLDYKISRESIIVIDTLTKPSLIDTAWAVSKDNMVRNEGLILQKYKPICLANISFESKIEKYKTIALQIAELAK